MFKWSLSAIFAATVVDLYKKEIYICILNKSENATLKNSSYFIFQKENEIIHEHFIFGRYTCTAKVVIKF